MKVENEKHIVSEKYWEALKELNKKLDENRSLQYKSPPHTKKYRDELRQEIDLLKKKQKLVKAIK